VIETLRRRFEEAAPRADHCTLRYVRERNERLSVRQDVVQPASTALDEGAMIAVRAGAGLGYAATCDLSVEGLRRAGRRALEWAERTAGKGVVDFRKVSPPAADGEYETPVRKPWASMGLRDKVDLLRRECGRLKTDPKIVDWEAGLWHTEVETFLLTAGGGTVRQRLVMLVPNLTAVASDGKDTQSRTFGGFLLGRQGGLETLDEIRFTEEAPRVAGQALELLAAPDCPSGRMSLLLAPDQMILQIHESIGHPVELDRILGDERNYAGTSFVTLDMFGTYRYGSELLNVTFDPTIPEQFASYGFDDDGLPARKEFVIQDGILVRPLGGSVSQARAGLEGTANARATSWNRPPIDRMANLNLEPGGSTFDALLRAAGNGVYMESNSSWSIDDSRNKFQFGCEYGRLIKDGVLGAVVKKPNYRGVSATFWRNLKAVGDRSTFQVLGTPYCGKGEPNQVVRVGHATPAALFADVDVFGGA